MLTLLLFALALTPPVVPANGPQTPDWAASVKLPAAESPPSSSTAKTSPAGKAKPTNSGLWMPATSRLTTKKRSPSALFVHHQKLPELPPSPRSETDPRQRVFDDALGGCPARPKFKDKGDAYSYKGHLVLLCDDWGVYEVNGRKRLFPAKQKGVFPHPAEKAGDWNRIEILVIGNRIRCIANGQLVADFNRPGRQDASRANRPATSPECPPARISLSRFDFVGESAK